MVRNETGLTRVVWAGLWPPLAGHHPAIFMAVGTGGPAAASPPCSLPTLQQAPQGFLPRPFQEAAWMDRLQTSSPSAYLGPSCGPVTAANHRATLSIRVAGRQPTARTAGAAARRPSPARSRTPKKGGRPGREGQAGAGHRTRPEAGGSQHVAGLREHHKSLVFLLKAAKPSSCL